MIWLVESNATLGAMSAFAILYGLDFIATVPPTVKLTVGTFGREMGPVVFGWIFAAHQPRGSLQIPPGVVSQIPPPARQDKGLLV
ncbi:hypothetical protein ABIF99_008567 [Bradyrhizobium japonicum]|nr:hypothetical protein [Bradyrhizobium japonicum]MCP1857420.1 hypothetical protein [Bradyrhizobium japonicum]MCP1888234.1 hypothetical protein [Bradyrhizobium japonicum]MCW2321209.1 hypothetical protein [Bradyrhizobium japonicum]